MTTTFAVTQDNDLFIGSDGNLSIATGIRAVLFAAQQAAQTQLGEMLFAVDQGIPNFQTVWNGAPNVAPFEAALRRTLLAVPGVNGVLALTVVVAENKLTYQATIQTIFGTGAINE